MSLVCEAFGCLPSQAVRELQEDPDRLALEILPLRQFRDAWRDLRTYEEHKRHNKKAKPPTGEIYDLVRDVEMRVREKEADGEYDDDEQEE